MQWIRQDDGSAWSIAAWQSQRESHCSVGLAIKLYLETIKIATIRMALIKDVLNKTSEKKWTLSFIKFTFLVSL